MNQNQEQEPNFIPAYDLLDVVEKIEKLKKLKSANEKLLQNDDNNKKIGFKFPDDDSSEGK